MSHFSQSFMVQFTMLPDMEELTQDGDTAIDSTRAERLARGRRKLCVMRSGARLFAVYADEVEATSESLRPTPLPFAPAPVRGVVSRRGRILTVIDPLPLLPPDAPSPHAAAAAPSLTSPLAPPLTSPPAAKTPAPLIVALRGDEQLALSVERIEPDIELYDDEDDHAADTTANLSPGSPPPPHLLRRTLQYHAGAIALLNPAHLFEAAMQGVERRRRRT